MTKLHTHYDNLKVSRDAPAGVIKAAYKALAQENHPDKCRDANAPKRMQIINDAYAVLSDASKRAAHDRWIATNEKIASVAAAAPAPTPKPAPAPVNRSNAEHVHAVYREAFTKERRRHQAELAAVRRFSSYSAWAGILVGIMVAVPLYMIFASIGNSIEKSHAAQAQQYQEANMRRN